jgi:hypothetical protein
MHEHVRFKLLFGPYRTPRFHYGDVVTCEIRGNVKIVGLTAARIPWPKCRTGKRCRAIILYGALADAVRRESAKAIEYWWGVGQFTVWKWRKALGVDRMTEGTSALMSRWAPETIQSEEAAKNLAGVQNSPERAAKIAATLRGKPRPKHVIKALIKANKGRKLSAKHRRKMSDAHKRNGRRPGMSWPPEDIALLGAMTDAGVAEQTGRTETAVAGMRERMGIAPFTKRAPRGKPTIWTPAKDRLLGTMSDVDLARRLRCPPMAVFYRRKRLKIAAFRV